MDKQWLAGFFDGEGCVYLQMRYRRDRIAPCFGLQVCITQNDKVILDEIQKEYGGTVYRHSGRRCYRWRDTGASTLRFFSDIQPYLKIKKSQVDLAIEFVNSIRKENLGSTPLDARASERRVEIHNRLKELKH